MASTSAGPPVKSPPLDPFKLNQSPAPIAVPAPKPTQQEQPFRSHETGLPITSPPSGDGSSGYLDTGMTETPSHPTIAETGIIPGASGDGGDGGGESISGILGSSPTSPGPGPKSGQLRRVPGGEKGQKEIIRLGSFGGDGLKAKPPPPPGTDGKVEDKNASFTGAI